MKLKFLLLLLLYISSFSQLKAGKVKRALKALGKQKFEKVEQLLVKSLEKDSINAGAHYAFSLLFVTDLYEDYNIDSAYAHINLSMTQYALLSPEDKRIKKLEKIGINDSTIQQQKEIVETLAFEHVSNTNTIEAYNYFLSHYSTAKQIPEAKRIRNELAYNKARKINTYNAYKHFIDTYPNAVQIGKASELYEFLLYENKTKARTLESYISFLKAYPHTHYTSDALDNIFELYTISNKTATYLKFIKDYPGNAFSRKAINYLYHLLKDQKGISFFETHYAKFISDSLSAIIALDKASLFPIYEKGLYGFKNNLGKTIIPPQYTAIGAGYICGNIPEDYLLVTDQNSRQIVNRQGDELFQNDYSLIAPLNDGLLLVGKKGKYGLLHVAGYVVAEPAYDTLYLLNRQYVKYREKNKWGLLSYTGRTITPALYDDIFIAGDFILFEKQGKFGIANDQLLFELANRKSVTIRFVYDDFILLGQKMILGIDGEEQIALNNALQRVVPKQRQVIYRLQEGWLIKKNDKFRFYSEEMIPLSNLGYDAAYYKGNWLALKKDSLWALLDQGANAFPEFQYDSLRLVGNHFAVGSKAGKRFIIFKDKQETELTKSASVQVLRPQGGQRDGSETYLLVKKGTNYKMLYNQKGEQIMEGPYTDVSMLGNAYFIVERYSRKGLVDTVGNMLLPIRYDGIGNYAEGFISTLRNQKFGLFNPVQEIEINPQYDVTLKVYSDSLFVAAKNHKLGLIDKSNNEVLPFQFDKILFWNDSLSLVQMNNQWHIYNILTQQSVLEDISSIKFVVNDQYKEAIILKDSQYGVISSKNLNLLPPVYDDVLNLGDKSSSIFFAEKRVKEASLYVVIYYNEKGEIIHQQTFSEEDYDHIYCF